MEQKKNQGIAFAVIMRLRLLQVCRLSFGGWWTILLTAETRKCGSEPNQNSGVGWVWPVGAPWCDPFRSDSVPTAILEKWSNQSNGLCLQDLCVFHVSQLSGVLKTAVNNFLTEAKFLSCNNKLLRSKCSTRSKIPAQKQRYFCLWTYKGSLLVRFWPPNWWFSFVRENSINLIS